MAHSGRGTLHLLLAAWSAHWWSSVSGGRAVAETDGITGTWDSIHIAEVGKDADKDGKVHYKLTTTIILQCVTTAEGVTNNVGGYRMQVVRGGAPPYTQCARGLRPPSEALGVVGAARAG